FLCQSFARPSAPPVVADRSDADEVFLHLMAELGVPWLRRRLIWGAVCWATMFSTAAIGRQRAPVSRVVARAILLVALLASVALLIARHDRAAVAGVLVAAPIALVVAGVVALGRPDRIADYVLVDVLTLLFLPMLALGGVLAVVTFLYLAIEDVCAGLPTVRRLWANFTSPAAKLHQLASPQFARLAAISEG
ncbi:MAG: hypothetical protein JWO68_3082, partial [Actinomycetia bacterium]|nr:hypothetical protein [Actinomycetes bacterium]